MSQGELPAYQNRSRENRERIVAALDEALKEKPFDQVSVVEIAERAGVAVGTVYQRFKNKDALIPVIFEIYKSRVEFWMESDFKVELEADDDLRTALRKIMRQNWAIAQREAHLLRAVHLSARLKPSLLVAQEWEKYEKASLQGITTVISHYAAEVGQKNTTRAAAFATYYLNTIFLEKALYPDETPATFYTLSGRSFADDCAEMLYAYLTLEPA